MNVVIGAADLVESHPGGFEHLASDESLELNLDFIPQNGVIVLDVPVDVEVDLAISVG
jgi:hypothetical protein